MDSHNLDGLINSLRGDLNYTLGESKKNWRNIWDRIKVIGASFKETRYPTRDEKDSAWARFQSIVDDVKNAQDEDRRKWKDKEQSSGSYKSQILSCVQQSKSSGVVGELAYSGLGLNIIESAINQIGGAAEDDHGKAELVDASSALKRGWDLLSSHKNEMTGRDKQEVFQALNDAQSQLDQAWTSYKRSQQSAHEARQRAWKEKQHDWEKKQQSWRQRVEGNIRKNENRLNTLHEMLDKTESHISDLENSIDSDSSQNYTDRVEGWIDEGRDKLRSLNDQINRVEGWIDEDRDKLR
ncbi:hypothetical protein KKE14_01910 [Patescibacteria group bacterium]|nr:hypothetical protein [Patescibacteria group bacterium]